MKEIKGRRWVRCPIQQRWVYVEDCEDCPNFREKRQAHNNPFLEVVSCLL